MILKYTKADTRMPEVIEGCTSIILGCKDNEFYIDVNVNWQQGDIIICPVDINSVTILQ